MEDDSSSAMNMNNLFSLSVRILPFLIDESDVLLLKSSFLSAMLDKESQFAKPEDGVYTIDADPECFMAFLYFNRYLVV